MNVRERDILRAAALRGRNLLQEIAHSLSAMAEGLGQLEQQLHRLPADGDPAAAAAQAAAEDLDLIPGWSSPMAEEHPAHHDLDTLVALTDQEVLDKYRATTRAFETTADGSKRWYTLAVNRQQLLKEIARRGLQCPEAWVDLPPPKIPSGPSDQLGMEPHLPPRRNPARGSDPPPAGQPRPAEPAEGF